MYNRVIRCYEGRSTAFDKHACKVIEDYRRIIACKYPPNIPTYKNLLKSDPNSQSIFLPPDVFFYGRESIQRLFLDIYIQARGQPLFLSELLKGVKERTSQHFLILGEGNTGKSTLLLKIFHDCKRGLLPYVPILVSLLRGDLDSEDSLYRLMADQCGFNNIDEFKFALKYNEGLLIMLDGLNESGIEHGFESIKKFAEKCKDLGVPLILTSRKIPGGEKAREELLSFATYDMVPLSIDRSAETLNKLFPGRAENILTALTGPSGNEEILTNPLMFTFLWRIVDELSDEELPHLTRTNIRQMVVEDWLREEGRRQEKTRPRQDQLKGTDISLNRKGRTRLGSRRLTLRERYLCHLGCKMVIDENRRHISYEDGVTYIQEIIEILNPTALNDENEFSEEVPEDLFDKLISGSLLKISSSTEEEKWKSIVSFDHESIRDFMAAEYFAIQILKDASLDDSLGSFISEAPRYSDLLSFISGCLPPEQAGEIVTKLLKEVGRKNSVEQTDERKEFLKCAVKCCVENRSLAPEIIDTAGNQLAKQFVDIGAVMNRREVGSLLTQLGHAHHNPEAFKQTLDILQRLVRIGIETDPKTVARLPDGRPFFFSQSIVEVLGFLGFPEDKVIDDLIDYLHVSIGDMELETFERYPWRAMEAFAALDWHPIILDKLQEFIKGEEDSKILAFGWHAIGALGNQNAVHILQENLEPDPKRDIIDCLHDAPVLLQQIREELQDEKLGLREVLLGFVRSQNKEERWCPTFLALLSDLALDEIPEAHNKRAADLLECRWKAAEIIVKSELSEKFYPLQRFLRDYKNYFYTAWAQKQASILEEMARHNKSPQEILKEAIEKMLLMDRTSVKEKLGDIDSLDVEEIKKKIKSCFDEGQRNDAGDKGFTWSTFVILGIPFKQLTSFDELNRMFNEAEKNIQIKQREGRPVDTYPRDILKKLTDENKEEEERQRE
jgi:hypothetical protein